MKVTRSLDNLWGASIACTPVTRRHLALRSLSFDRLFFYLTLEAENEKTPKKKKRPREKGTCNSVLWLIYLNGQKQNCMRPYLLAFFTRISLQESEKGSEEKFKACVLLLFCRLWNLSLFASICGLYVAYRSNLSLWTDERAIDFFLNNLNWMEYEI